MDAHRVLMSGLSYLLWKAIVNKIGIIQLLNIKASKKQIQNNESALTGTTVS